MAMASSSSVMPSATRRSSSGTIEPVDLAGVLGHRAGVHRPRAGVGVRRRRRVDAVGQAATLADLVEQPARQAAAEHVVDDVERLAIGVAAWHRAPTDRQVHLLGVVVDGDVAPRERPGARARRPAVAGRHRRRTPPRRRRRPRRGRRRRRRRSSWRRCGSARRRSRARRSAAIERTVARSPAVSRPRPWSPNSWRASVRRATSSGESSSIASSSRMTWRSLSTSSSAISELVSTSPSSSMPAAPWRRGIRQ